MINTVPSFAPAIARAMGDDLDPDPLVWFPEVTSDPGGFVGPPDYTETTDSDTPSWLGSAISTATNAAINAAKGALGIRTTTPIRRTGTTAMPSWLLPVGIGLVALVIMNGKKK